MPRNLQYASLVLALLVASASLSGAAPLQQKDKAKAGTKQGVKGTTQMAGDNGKIGTTYTLGHGDKAINFTLTSAAYSVDRILDGSSAFMAGADEKFLVLHFTLHNPNKTENMVNWATLTYTAIDSNNVNHQVTGNGSVLFDKDGTHEAAQIVLKPAQKVAFYTALRIPSDVTVPKLIVQMPEALPVLRVYFAKGDIKPLASPFGDPSGVVALREVPSEAGVYYPASTDFDVKLVSGAYSQQVGSYEASEGKRLFVATVSVKNSSLTAKTISWGAFLTGVKTDDGEKTNFAGNRMYKSARDEDASNELQPGEEYTVRILIEIPVGAKVSELRLRENDSARAYLFKVPPVP
jgi:hypothetical protein